LEESSHPEVEGASCIIDDEMQDAEESFSEKIPEIKSF